MGRSPCCDKTQVKRGPWSPQEDQTLKSYLQKHGTGGNWITLPQKAGLKRCGKSCRLRWLNYLRPDIKHGGFTAEEDDAIYTLYRKMGSRWSIIASHLPGRTDNDVKNHWNTKLKKKLSMTMAEETSANNNDNNNNNNNNSTVIFDQFHDPTATFFSSNYYYYYYSQTDQISSSSSSRIMPFLGHGDENTTTTTTTITAAASTWSDIVNGGYEFPSVDIAGATTVGGTVNSPEIKFEGSWINQLLDTSRTDIS